MSYSKLNISFVALDFSEFFLKVSPALAFYRNFCSLTIVYVVEVCFHHIKMSSKSKSNDKSGSKVAKKRKIDSPITDEKQNNVAVSDNAIIGNKLPDDVLKRIEVKRGKVVIAGTVSWDTIGRKTLKDDRYELAVFHRLDDRMVTDS